MAGHRAMSLMDLALHPDPDTPQCLLPPHLRRGDNSREEMCRRAALRHALAMLSPKQREALHLRYTLGLSFRKLAAELGISQSAAAKRVNRSQETLRALVGLCVQVQKELCQKDHP